jgi:nitroreductase
MIDFGELGTLIKSRRSVRKYQDKPVPEDLLLKALELATWAPNGGNYQPWRFLIVTNKQLIQKMGQAVKAKTELICSWAESTEFGETVERWRRSADFFRHAPVCIAVLMGKYISAADRILSTRGEADAVAQEIRACRELGNSSLQSVAAAVANLLLILHYFGLGATWMAAPQTAKKEIEELLHVSPDWDFVDLIPVGYPAETPRVPARKPVAEVVEFIR